MIGAVVGKAPGGGEGVLEDLTRSQLPRAQLRSGRGIRALVVLAAGRHPEGDEYEERGQRETVGTAHCESLQIGMWLGGRGARVSTDVVLPTVHRETHEVCARAEDLQAHGERSPSL